MPHLVRTAQDNTLVVEIERAFGRAVFVHVKFTHAKMRLLFVQDVAVLVVQRNGECVQIGRLLRPKLEIIQLKFCRQIIFIYRERVRFPLFIFKNDLFKIPSFKRIRNLAFQGFISIAKHGGLDGNFTFINIGANENIRNSLRTWYAHFYFSKDTCACGAVVPTKLRLVIAKVRCTVDFIAVVRIAVHRNRRTRYVIFHYDKQDVIALMDIVGDIDAKRCEKALVPPCHSAVDIHFGNIIHRLKI